MRLGFVNGTHALTAAMFATVKPGDTILAATGLPYDTLRSAIGISGDCHGSLKFYGIDYAQVDMTPEGSRTMTASPRGGGQQGRGGDDTALARLR